MLGVGRMGPRLDPSGGGIGPARSTGSAPAEGTVDPVGHRAGTGADGAGKGTEGSGRAAAAELDAWAVLASVRGLGPVTFAALIERLGSASAVVRAATGPHGGPALLEALAAARRDVAMAGRHGVGDDGDGDEARRPLVNHDLAGRIAEAVAEGERYLERIRALGLTVVTLDDPAYPLRLRAIEMPPPLLFVRGDAAALAAARAVAVVGTRRPSDGGRRVAGRLAGAIARAGATIVSGLAVGIDGVAHAAAVAERGRTVGVLGGGHARIYPRAHGRLADAIVAEGGAIVAELAPDTPPSRGSFPRRNRLISGLADATVVVEAAARSGALITAGWALEQGRGCFLVPGAVDAPMSSGCLAFLREWPGEARIVAGIPELLEDIGLESPRVIETAEGPAADGRAALAGLGEVERVVAGALVDGRASVDDLAAATALPVATILGTLTLLEMRGLAAGSYGRYRPAGRLATMPLPSRRGRPPGGAAEARSRGAFARVGARVLP